MNVQDFERCFIETVLELADGLYPTQVQFALAVWPGKTEGSANTTLSAIKNQNSRGKRQSLRLWEAVRMAQAVGKSYESICFEVNEKLKLGWARSGTLVDGLLMERCMVTLADKLSKKKFPSTGEFARKAFPKAASPEHIWRYVRLGQNGKPRRITMEDATHIALALGLDVASFCWKAKREIEDGWTLEQDVFFESAPPPGRPVRREVEKTANPATDVKQ